MAHKLLLADDSITIQRVIELTFAEEDVQVFAVGDGKHAIDRIQSERPDIVLADVGMPERDGYEVAAFIKGNPQFAHIPVLLLTGAFEPIDETRARAVGCDGVLVKPFEPQMVINRVKDLLAGRRAGTPGTPAASSTAQPAPVPDASAEAIEAPKPPDSLEDYFDRLDAAFATLGADSGPHAAPAAVHAPAAPAPQPAVAHAATVGHPATVEDFASWDPELAGDANRPAALSAPPVPHVAVAAPLPVSVHVSVGAPPVPAPAPEPPPAFTAAPFTAAPAVVPTSLPGGSQIPLAEAFAALLAAEQGQTLAPASRPAPAPGPEVVEDIVRRVLDRLQDQDVRQTVVDVAERLVREEIDRIKRANG